MSLPWDQPGADPLADLREFMRWQERQYAALFSLPPPSIGPEPLRCPVCQLTRMRCLAVFGRGGQHEQDIREHLARRFPGG